MIYSYVVNTEKVAKFSKQNPRFFLFFMMMLLLAAAAMLTPFKCNR